MNEFNNPNEERLRELLSDANPAIEPSDDLQRRVRTMASKHDARQERRFWPLRPVRFAMAMSLFLVVGAGLAYKLFHRSGEQAIQLIPADALLVCTLDTTPSPEQVPIFTRIARAIREQDIAQKTDQAIGEFVEKGALSAEIRPYVSGSLAFAIMKSGALSDVNSGDAVVFLALKNADQVGQILARHGSLRLYNGIRYYRFRNEEQCAALIAGYLVLSKKPVHLMRVARVYSGELPSVATLPDYQTARADVPADANMMLFLSPTALASAEKASKGIGVNPLRGTRWMALAATLRDRGIEFDYRFPVDSAKMPGLNALSNAAPLTIDAYRRLPSGAYGAIGVSQPGKFWEYIKAASTETAKDHREFDRGIVEFEKETGIDVRGDILPALDGNAWLAVYPDGDGPKSGVDMLIVLDDAHGANAAGLAAKVRAYVERSQVKDKGKRLSFDACARYGANEWRLKHNRPAEESRDLKLDQRAGRKGHATVYLPPGMELHLDPQGMADSISVDARETTGHKNRPDYDLFGDKWDNPTSYVHAQIGRAVLIATSQPMLDRAILAYTGQAPSLADDPAFAAMRGMAGPKSQSIFMVNLGSIMERLRPIITKAAKDWDVAVDPDVVIRLFGGPDAGLVSGTHFDGQLETGSFFLPLDYERAAKLLGEAGNAVKHKSRLRHREIDPDVD